MKSIIYILLLLFFSSPIINPQDKYRLKYNNVDISFDNKGAIGVNAGGYRGGYFEDEVFLFSSGFALSGYKDGSLFVNGVMPSSLVDDYLPGKIGTDPFDLKNILYEVSLYPAFNSSWVYWKYAVELGADFMDGDGDGLYNPVDKNGNNVADDNEDRPFIEGEINVWTIYNDGVPASLRRYVVPPFGIEIQQNIFAYSEPALKNIIFIRYRITYKGLSGTDSAELDSVLFSIWSDSDMGDATDDLVGTDSLLNGSYTYNDSSDFVYGDNPPAFFQNFLQTPAIYIAGVTFIDNNSNNVFDADIDTPLDTAYSRKGNLGIVHYNGASDFGLNTSAFSLGGDPIFDTPNNTIELRDRMKGLGKQASKLDPCTSPYGVVNNMECNEINPLFCFSGDPVTNTGWLNNVPTDIRTFSTTAPFRLIKDEPVDIIIAYVVGRGTDALNSITVAKGLSKAAIEYYESNFTQIPVGILDEPKQVVKEFKLNQNYPNPFNPSTTLSYVIGSSSFVNISVYDILGNKVSELVNEERTAGEYSIEFDGKELSSGVYFYKLTAVPDEGQAELFTSSGKMILMK